MIGFPQTGHRSPLASGFLPVTLTIIVILQSVYHLKRNAHRFGLRCVPSPVKVVVTVRRAGEADRVTFGLQKNRHPRPAVVWRLHKAPDVLRVGLGAPPPLQVHEPGPPVHAVLCLTLGGLGVVIETSSNQVAPRGRSHPVQTRESNGWAWRRIRTEISQWGRWPARPAPRGMSSRCRADLRLVLPSTSCAPVWDFCFRFSVFFLPIDGLGISISVLCFRTYGFRKHKTEIEIMPFGNTKTGRLVSRSPF